MTKALRGASLALSILTPAMAPSLAAAQQPFEAVGMRALGMAGAFVAVADDASAAYWNPAGLATAGPLGMTIGWSGLQSGNRDAPVSAGPFRDTTSFTSLGAWPVGLFYGRFETTTLSTDAAGLVTVRRLETFQFGGTVLQSITEGLVVGSSLKYVRGNVASGLPAAGTVDQALDAGDELDGDSSGAFDLDLGVMVDFERARLGLTVRNLLKPKFADLAGNEMQLARQARLGLALLVSDGLTLAIDVDLDAVDLRGDLRRMIAIGGESRVGERMQVRAGVRWDLRGAHQTVATTGASFALRRGLWVEGYALAGGADAERGFGFGLRAGY